MIDRTEEVLVDNEDLFLSRGAWQEFQYTDDEEDESYPTRTCLVWVDEEFLYVDDFIRVEVAGGPDLSKYGVVYQGVQGMNLWEAFLLQVSEDGEEGRLYHYIAK